MPLYQLECEKCIRLYEVIMSLESKDEFDAGKIWKECPICGNKLVGGVFLPVRLSSKRVCLGY